MTMETETQRGKARWRLRILGAAGVLIGLPMLLFLAASWSVNRTSISPELAKVPPEWEAVIAAASNASPSSSPANEAQAELSPPIATRARGDGDTGNPLAMGPHLTTITGRSGTFYDAFLEAELREHPDLEGARLYLELSRQCMPGGDLHEAYEYWSKRVVQRDAKLGTGEALPADRAEWLVAHADLVEPFLAFAESPGVPRRTLEAFANDPEPVTVPMPLPSMLEEGARMLTSEGCRRLRAGDPTGAVRYWRGAVRILGPEFAEPAFALITRLGAFASLDEVVSSVADLVGGENIPPEALEGLREILADAHRTAFAPGWIGEFYQINYPPFRRILGAECATGSWRSVTFGWDVDVARPDVAARYRFTVAGLPLPRVDRIAATALDAMRNRRDAPRLLREYDTAVLEASRQEQKTWPELAKSHEMFRYRSNPFAQTPLGSEFCNIPRTAISRTLFCETRLNLVRAAIEWRLAPADAKPDPAAMTIEGRESPWRDPFAEAPFRAKALAGGGGVLLYSLGPDLKDQQGQVEFEKFNPYGTPGDLTFQVKR